MENIHIEQSDTSPKVTLNATKGLIELYGKSYPENTFRFYEEIIVWISTYFENHEKEETTINLKLTYFNSATNSILYNLLYKIDNSYKNKLSINWYYDEENTSSLEDYEDYADEFPHLNIQAIIDNKQ